MVVFGGYGLGFGSSPPSLTLKYDDIIASLHVTFITQSWKVLQGPILSGTAYGETVGRGGRRDMVICTKQFVLGTPHT
jgi:hypothetical protein